MEISPARPGEASWCANVMAFSDPWLALGRGYGDCLARLTHPEYLLLVARPDESPAGFVLLHPRGFAGSPYIAAIAVADAFRGRGIGARLLARAEAEFPEARHIFLLVSSFNTRARELYERHEYRFVGELTDYVVVGASEIILHKRLRA